MSDHNISEHNRLNQEELGHFLRARRERLTPEDVGLAITRSRRTPGLRREEVAYLADIGVKWYARLEMGDDVHPSPRTLLGISRALRLSQVDTEYLFDLAKVGIPKEPLELHIEVPETLTRFVVSLREVMAAVTDPFLTPLRWNAITDAVWPCSPFSDPLERNTLVRAFNDDGFVRKYAGADFDRMIRDVVSLFRRYYTAGEPSLFVRQIYERIESSPLFRELWDARTVTDSMYDGSIITRHHPSLGPLSLIPLDLLIPHRGDIVLKLWFAANGDTQEKFLRLDAMGSAWSPAFDRAWPNGNVDLDLVEGVKVAD